MLEELNHCVSYCDTDRVVYIANEQTKKIVNKYIEDGLGNWTDELKGNHIKLWCAVQAKDSR